MSTVASGQAFCGWVVLVPVCIEALHMLVSCTHCVSLAFPRSLGVLHTSLGGDADGVMWRSQREVRYSCEAKRTLESLQGCDRKKRTLHYYQMACL